MKWSNFFSYGTDNYLQLDAEGVQQLIAGNGAGKTSILLILEELLYGKNHKGVKKSDLKNRNLKAKILLGEVGFTKDNDKFVVAVNRSTTLKVIITKNGIDISRHTGAQSLKLVEDILGINYTLFNQLTYLSTDSKLRFLTDTDTERKKFLIKLFQLDKYLETHEIFKGVAKNLDSDIKQLLGGSDTLQRLTKKDTALAAKAEEAAQPVPEPYNSLNKSTLESDLFNIKKINTRIQRNNSYTQMLSDLDKSVLATSVSEPDTEGLQLKQQAVGGFTTKIANNKARIAKIDKLGDKCPTCFSSIDTEGVANLKAQSTNRIQSLETELSTIQQEITTIKQHVTNYTKYTSVSDEFERLTNLIDEELEEQLLDKSAIEAELRDIKQKITSREETIKSILASNNKAVANNFAIKAAIENIEKYKSELVILEADITAKSNLLGTATTLKDIFSTKGLLSYKLQFLVQDLEKQINTYLAELSKGRFLLNFALSGDKLNVVIVDEGKEIAISALSTGEISLVEVATLLAVRKLMCAISGTSINLLFLDEVISVLQDNNKEIVLELLMKEKNLNILTVSHGYEHPLISKLKITKREGVSHIEEF